MKFEHQKQLIRRDLASFADPGTISLDEDSRSVLATWRIRGRGYEATFYCRGTSGIQVDTGHGQTKYADFLAGPDMANLRQVAQSITSTTDKGIFVETRCLGRADDTEPISAIEMLNNLVDKPIGERTEVIIVTGEAGSGKTHILREMVRQQAMRYLHGEAEHVFLYIDAQGRALYRWEEALATELQDLRVALTYHSIATLTRVGLVVPVIDGFDELLAARKYEDPFSALETFLRQLHGEGKIIASARSVYYEGEFLSRGNSSLSSEPNFWSHELVRLHDWDSKNQRDFLEQLAHSKQVSNNHIEQIWHRLDQVFSNRHELRSKPFYFVTLSNLLLRDDARFDDNTNSDLLEVLTEALLKREQREKLLDRHERPLLSIKQLHRLLNEVAEEMWNQETRQLDLESIRFVADYVLDAVSMGEKFKIVKERMPSLAFFAPPKDRIGRNSTNAEFETVGFEHEAFFFYFLSCRIVERYLDLNSNMQLLLGRSPLPQFVADRIALELSKEKKLESYADLRNVVDRCSSAGKRMWIRTTQVRENSGQIILAILAKLRDELSHPIELRRFKFESITLLGGSLEDVSFLECSFRDVTMRRTSLQRARFENCICHSLLLDEVQVESITTKLDLRGLEASKHVFGLDVIDSNGRHTTYDITEILRVLRDSGMTQILDVAPEDFIPVSPNITKMMDKLMRSFRRSNPISTSDQRLQSVIKDPHWKDLLDKLIKHRIIEQVDRPVKNKRTKFYRCRFPASGVMRGQTRSEATSPKVADFWRSLSE